jgi:fumarate hydratase class II
MADTDYRVERDSMGETRVPAHALWGSQTQRAIQNFPISGLTMPRAFIGAIGLVKWAAAGANLELGDLDRIRGSAIQRAALEVAEGRHDAHFPVDVFQTGSGTSTNMNANEVIARLATQYADGGSLAVHPNDHVNRGQSSNDVIPTAIHLSAALVLSKTLLPALRELVDTIARKAGDVGEHVKTGRTHLMDAMPVTLAQEMGAWRTQLEDAAARLQGCRPRLHALAQGGTAVGSGVNVDPRFALLVAAQLSRQTGLDLRPARDFFAALASQDTAVELSGHLRTLAVALMKIANDLRWMNSGPLAGLARSGFRRCSRAAASCRARSIRCAGSVAMVAAQVMGNDVTVTIAGPVGQLPAERDAAPDRLQPAAQHRTAGRRVPDAGAQLDRGLRGEHAAARAGARAQSDAGDGAEPRHRLRPGGGHRQACLRGGAADPGRRRRDDRPRARAPRATARPGRPHAWRRARPAGVGGLN